MVERLIEVCAREKYIVLMITVAVVVLGIWTLYNQPIDAIPDLSDTQVIIYSKWDRSPDVIEDQVTYPITTALLGAPKVKAIRGFSDFGFSYVYIIFEDGTDIYWARSRVLEYLSKVAGIAHHPVSRQRSVRTPQASAGYSNTLSSMRVAPIPWRISRSFQDWNLRFALQSVPGVAEVASIGRIPNAVSGDGGSHPAWPPTIFRSLISVGSGAALRTTK